MTDQSFKAQIYEQFSRIGKALSHPGRIEILDLLSQGEKSVESLTTHSQLGSKNTSAQLKELKLARLVTSRKQGKHILYRLNDDSVLAFLHLLRRQSERQFPEIDSLNKKHLPKDESVIALQDQSRVIEGAAEGSVVLLDVRPEDEFRAGHLPHAISIPIGDLKRRIPDIPRGKKLVVYCRGPYCVWAAQAVDTLLDRGFDAYRLEMGVSEWRLMGESVPKMESPDDK
ncbi:MAG: ArsR family transcriptional regulator [Bdellovibrionales bacterium]|nr:ArsR family transcriptional regulator [Bdellovibrionales bacterium]